MNSPATLLRSLGLSLALAATSAASLSAQTVAAIRTQLTMGDYAAAVTAADAAIAAPSTPADDLADARFFRAYARLIDAVEKEGVVFAKKIGATTAGIDLFTDDVDIQFPEVIVYAKSGLFSAFTKTGASYTLPNGFDHRPLLAFTNTDKLSPRSITLKIDADDYWGATLEDTANDYSGNVSGQGGFIEAYSDNLSLLVESGLDPILPTLTLNLEPNQKVDLRVDYNTQALKFTIAQTNAKISTAFASPFVRSGSNYALKAEAYAPEPALSFENTAATPYDLVLDFGATPAFGLNFDLDGDYRGYLYREIGDTFISGDTETLGTLSGNRLTITIEPKCVLTVTAYRASPGFALLPIGTLPKTLLAKNGDYATGKFPKFAPNSNTNLLFTTLATLDATTLAKSIADLAAIPADHENRLTFQEALQGREIVVQHADRQASLALLKSIQAFGLLGKTLDLGFSFATPGFYDSLDPLAFINSSKTLLGAGKASPADRARFQTLLTESANHTLAALDAGIQTRADPVDAEYLFALGEGPASTPRIALDAGSYRFTGQVARDGDESIAFRNTTAAEKTLVLRLEGKPADPEYFGVETPTWLEAGVTLDDGDENQIYADAETLSIGRYVSEYNPETETYDDVFHPLGELVSETGEWTVTLPAYSVLRLDFQVAALDAALAPVSGLPSGVQAVIGEAAIGEDELRADIADFKTALAGSIPASRLGLDDLPSGSTFSLAPLFAAKPFNPRATLPKIGEHGILRGDSARLLASGFLGQVSVTDWENFLAGRDSLDLVTPPKITPLKITVQPLGADLAKGANYTLSVTADGYPVPAYQWLKNGQVIEGATASTYTLADVGALDIATYQVRLVGGANTQAKPLLSAAAKVTVKAAPVIVTQPVVPNTLVPASAKVPVTLAVGALGYAPLTYQWYKGDVAIPKATSAKLVLPAATASTGTYHVVVTNAYGSATSDDVSFTVLGIVTTALPATKVLNVGQPLALSITATGAGDLSYQWEKNGEPLDGETASTFTIAEVSGDDIGGYRVVITSEAGTYTSPAVAVTVNLAPATFAGNGKTITFTGSGVSDGESYDADTTYTVSGAGKMTVYDNFNDASGTAGYTYTRKAPVTAVFTGTVSAPASEYSAKHNATLTFTSPTAGTYTDSGTETLSGQTYRFTESGTFEIYDAVTE